MDKSSSDDMKGDAYHLQEGQFDENLHDGTPTFEKHYNLGNMARTSSNISIKSRGSVKADEREDIGSDSNATDYASPNDRTPSKLSRTTSNTNKSSSDAKIRRGPVLLRKTLSSLSMSSLSGSNSNNNSTRSNSHAAPPPSLQRADIDEDPNDTLHVLTSSASHDNPSIKHRQRPTKMNQIDNNAKIQAPSRKQSFAEALFKKIAGSGSANAQSRHGSTDSAAAAANKHNHTHGHKHRYHDNDDNNNNNNNNKDNDTTSLHSFTTNNSGRRLSRDSIGNAPHMIESMPNALRRKVSTLVHGIGHEFEGSQSNNSTNLNMTPIKKSVTASETVIPKDRGTDSDRPTMARHKTVHLLIPSESTPSSRRSSTLSTTSDNSPSISEIKKQSTGNLDETQNGQEHDHGKTNEVKNDGIFQLDTNLNNVSDITKLPTNSRRTSVCAPPTSLKGISEQHQEKEKQHEHEQKHHPPEAAALKSYSSADLQLTKCSSVPVTSDTLSKVKTQQWVAPENWDVESDLERPKTKKSTRGTAHGGLLAGHRRGQQKHKQREAKLSSTEAEASSEPKDIARVSSGPVNSLKGNLTGNQTFSSGTSFTSATESSGLDSSASASDYSSSDNENYPGSNAEKIHATSPANGGEGPSPNTSNYDLNTEGSAISKEATADDEQHDKVEYELERYYKDFSDLDPKRHYAIRIFNTDDTFTTLSCTPGTTVRDMIPALKRKFNISTQGSYQLSLKVGKLSKILRPYSKPIIIERKLLLLNGYRKTDPLHIMGIEDLSFVFKFLFHPVAPFHLSAEQEQRLMRSDFIHVDLRGMDLTTPPIIFYQHTSEIESLDLSNNANIFLPLEFIETAIKLSSLRMVNIRASRFPANVTASYKIVSLELQRNFIRKVPGSISELCNLTILNLQCNELDKLPKGFGQLKNLQLLDLSSNRFVHYPEVINNCTSLLQMNLSYNKIHTLPESINQLNKLAKMNLSHNKLTVIGDLCQMKNLRTLNLQHNRIASIKTGASNLQNLFLTDNRISNFNDILPKLRALEIQENPITSISYKDFYPMNLTSLSLNKAKLASVPSELFVKLSRLEKLDLSENNLAQLPDEICLLNRLVFLSVARNKLESLPNEFPQLRNLKSLDLHSNNIRNFVGGMEEIELTFLNVSSNMLGNSNSTAPFYQDISSDSKLAKSLMFMNAADNQFDDQMWPLFNCFSNLKILNLSYNNFQDISNLKLENLLELYFSGNKLSTLPGDIVLKWKSLKTLMLNGNHLLSLPAELSQLTHLNVFDVGSNQLKYNISNYHYDWNWRDNKELKYLNLSGNRRFEIRSFLNREINADLSDLTVLPNLKILGLMDVTLNTSKVPDENINFRMRTTASMINGMRYGVADTLGQRDYVSSRDVTFERFRGKDDECLLCLHDGKNQNAAYGHNISRLIRDIYDKILIRQLEKYGESDEGVKKALRFSFLQVNKEVNGMLSSVDNGANVANLTSADLLSGSCSTVIYIKGSKMFTANIGDCMAILSKNNGDFQKLTKLHVPYKRDEYERIRISGGYVNDDKLDGVVDVSRAVGFFDLLPHIHASPDISLVTLTKAEEMLIVATHKLWEFMDYETTCDIARENSSEPMLAAEAMKDHAIAYGCSDNLTILCLSLYKSNEQQNRFTLNKNSLITRRSTFEDTTLRRLQPEIAPPTGNLAIVFTDIKNSTFLWELFPNAMRTAIKTHNDIMRRLLRIYGGYEVKTEGDAFMVAFPTPISSMVWCMSVQLKLLDAQWPEEITSIQDGCLILDKNGNKIYQGLSVRMGVHWGCPVPELDLVTQRMDYLGPMVNKAARVEGVADGGQITLSSDFCSEFSKILMFHERVVKDKEPLKDVYGEEFIGEVLEKEIAMLESIGWVLFEHGEQKLKGLETKELITIAYPRSLASRHNFVSEDEQTRLLNQECIFRLRAVSRKLESVLSAVSGGYLDVEHRRRTGKVSHLDETVQNSVTINTSEKETVAFFDHLITRVESFVTLLKLQQVTSSGLECYRNGDNGSAQKSIFELLDEILDKLEK